MSKKIVAVIHKAQNDKAYAKKLHEHAVAATAGGTGSPAWKTLMEHFAGSPEELAAMSPTGIGGTSAWTTTITTTTTVTCPECASTTTTTTTTGN